MKKIIALLLALILVVAVLAGCQKKAPEVTEINFWTFQELHVEYYQKMVDKWNAKNPDKPIKLNPTVYPYDDMHSNLAIALQSGTGAPDLVDIEAGKYANFLKGDIQLIPLNDIVEPELKNIVKARVDIYSKNGNYYGICFHVGAAVIYYNTELCKLAGVDYENIKTWDEYYAAAKKLKAVAPDKYWMSVEATEIEFWTFQALHVEFYEEMAREWNELNPDRQITLKTDVYEFEQMHELLGNALLAGTGAPDLVDIEFGKYANFLRAITSWFR